MMRQDAGTHRADALTKGGREGVEDIYGWRKPLCESLIASLRSIEFVGFPFKYGEYSFRRVTAFYFLCEGVGAEFLSGLLLVFAQGPIEDWLIIRIGCGTRCGSLETGRHGIY